MKLTIKKSTLVKIVRFLKWTKIAAKLAAIGTTLSGAVVALSGSASAGVAVSAAGATTYAASKGLPNGYEKTKHIPPGRVNKQANLLRQKEIEQSVGKQNKSDIAQKKKMQGSVLSVKHPVGRPLMGMSSANLTSSRSKK